MNVLSSGKIAPLYMANFARPEQMELEHHYLLKTIK